MSEGLIGGVRVTCAERYLWLHSERPLHTLSSAVVGGGMGLVHDILSVRVPLSYDQADPAVELLAAAGGLGIPSPFVGLLTAVDLSTAAIERGERGDLRVAVVASVGVGNAQAAGSPTPAAAGPGTINLVVLADADLSLAVAVNLVITATEAKSLALLSAGVKTHEGEPASGTSSDAVVVAWTGRGPRPPYGGPATDLGAAVGAAVRRAIGSRLQEGKCD